MVSPASMGVLMRTLFIVLFCVMVASFVYLFIAGDYTSCFDIHARWFIQITGDFTTYVVVIGAWVAYKESSWIIATTLMLLMYCLGSLVSIGYILRQFYKLSHEEFMKDPIYFVLARRQKRDVNEGASVVAARVTFSGLGCLMLGILIYTLTFELFPSCTKSFTSCLVPNAVDSYIHIAMLSVWVAYKESSWTSAFFWIVLLVCFRGVTVCAYIVRQLFYLSPQEPAFLIIFNNDNRYFHSTDPLLLEHPDV